MTEKNPKSLIKSRSRVQEFGEVFTSEKEVENMLSLFDHELERPESRFLEPACGNGNFLSKIAEKKLVPITLKYKKNQMDFEKYSILAASSIYGIDIIEENVIYARDRLKEIFQKNYRLNFKKINKDFILSIEYIFNNNIIYGDALTLTQKNKSKLPIIFPEWSFINSTHIKRRDFTFKHLIDARPFDGFNLFSDLGDKAFISEPSKDHPAIYFLKLYESK